MSMRIDLTPDEERAVADAYPRTWWLWLIAGILWSLLGFIVLSLRPASITACAILIATRSGSAASPTRARLRARGRLALARHHRRHAGAARRHRRDRVAGAHARRDLRVRRVVPAGPRTLRCGHRAVPHPRARWWMPLIAGIVGIAWAPGRSATPTARCCCWCRSSASGRSSRESPISWRASSTDVSARSWPRERRHDPTDARTPDDATESVEAETAAAPAAAPAAAAPART